MKQNRFAAVAMLLGLMALAACSGTASNDEAASAASRTAVSGRIEAGLRVLTIDPTVTDPHFRIYRGDYVRLESMSGESFTVEIPALDIVQVFPAPEGERPYFKVPAAGSFPFRIGDISGLIEAFEYRAAAYREVTAAEAAELIENLRPLVLDVRSRREFATGHLMDARLIPVQIFKQQIGQLAGHEKEPVFVYCRTGNRSTVAAKMLVDAGFEQIINLRRGIVEWERAGLPVVK